MRVLLSFFSIGSILSEVERPIKNTCLIRARVVVFAIQVPITKGFMVSSQLMCNLAIVQQIQRGPYRPVHFFPGFFFGEGIREFSLW